MKKIQKIIFIFTIIISTLISGSIAKAESYHNSIEGFGSQIIKGVSYPSGIEISGYDTIDNKLYLNFTLETTKNVNQNKSATFNYYIQVFNASGTVIASSGSYNTPELVTGNLGETIATVTNKELSVSGALPSAIRIVIIVKTVSVQ